MLKINDRFVTQLRDSLSITDAFFAAPSLLYGEQIASEDDYEIWKATTIDDDGAPLILTRWSQIDWNEPDIDSVTATSTMLARFVRRGFVVTPAEGRDPARFSHSLNGINTGLSRIPHSYHSWMKFLVKTCGKCHQWPRNDTRVLISDGIAITHMAQMIRGILHLVFKSTLHWTRKRRKMARPSLLRTRTSTHSGHRAGACANSRDLRAPCLFTTPQHGTESVSRGKTHRCATCYS